MYLTHDTDSTIDPQAIKRRSGVRATTEQTPHESRDHCSTGTVGRAVVGVTNDADELLLLVNDEHGVALLPNETAEPDDSWLDVAGEAVAGQTGISADVAEILAVRTVEHVTEDDEDPHLTTHRVVFAATATGGEIRECKRHAENGSDGFRAGWFDGLPDGIDPAPGGASNDVGLFLE